MEPGEGSAAPKATVALPGTDVNPAGRAPARLAVHCILATGGPGAAMRHAPFGRPRRPLGTFPRGESTSSARRRTKPPTRNRFLVEGKGKDLPCLFCFAEGFASAEATRGLSDRPLDPFGGPSLCEWAKPLTRNTFLAAGRKRAYLSSPRIAKDFASAEATKGLSARPLETFGRKYFVFLLKYQCC